MSFLIFLSYKKGTSFCVRGGTSGVDKLTTPEKSDRQIANALGVSPTTIGSTRHKMEDNGQLSQLDSSVGADGKERPRQAKRKPVSVLNPTKREEKALKYV